MSSKLIEAALAEHREALDRLTGLVAEIEHCGSLVGRILSEGRRVFICGNGGSAADAQHFAAEITGYFERPRRGYAAIALTTDTSALTAIGNDDGFEAVFERQLLALASEGDLLIAISTSGNSNNVLRAARAARAHGVHSIGLLGRDGGKLIEAVDQAVMVPARRTSRIQEMHVLILHLWCEMFEASL